MEQDYQQLGLIFTSRFHAEDFQYLYRSLPNRELNPQQWDDQIKFFTSIIKKWGSSTNVIEFSAKQASSYMRFNSIIPNILPSLRYLENQKIIKKRDDVVKNRSVLGTIASKIIGMLWNTNNNECDKYIFVSNLKMVIDVLINRIVNQASSIIDLVLTNEEIKKMMSGLEEDLLWAELERNKNVRKLNGGFYFISLKNKNKINNEFVESILDDKILIKKLGDRMEELDAKINKQINNARKFYKDGKKKDALTCLRYKKAYEKQLEQMSALNDKQIQILYNKIDHEISSRFLNEMQNNLEYLKNFNGPTCDEIENVQDEMDDIVKDTNYEIGTFDESELENELNQLVDNNNNQKQADEKCYKQSGEKKQNIMIKYPL